MESQFLLAKAKDEEIATKGECGGAVSALFKYLLDQDLVDGVLTLTRGEDIYDGIPILVEDSKDIISTCGSLHCAPTMFGDLISKYLTDMRLAVSVKPCDAMAINELIKRHQINEDNLYKIGLNCGGAVMPISAQKMIEMFYDVDPSEVVKEEIDKGKFIIELEDGTHKSVEIDELEEKGFGRRINCQRCELKIPRNADLACGNWGAEPGWTFIEVVTEKGAKLLNDAKKGGYIEVKTPSQKAITIRGKIGNAMIKLAQKYQVKYHGLRK